MKNIFLLIIFLFFNRAMFAQSMVRQSTKDSLHFIEDKTVKNEFGFDMFYFLNIFRQNFEGQPSSVFSISFNRELSDKIALRTTLGAGYTNYKSNTNAIPTLKTKVVETIFRTGIAWEKPGFRRWKLYYGADLEFQYGFNNYQQYAATVNSVEDNITENFILGPGPFAGLIFYINPRISLSIESTINFVYSNSSSRVVDSAHPEMNTNTNTKGFTTTYITPQNMFLNIKF
ncbi:MAG TPA: hypothetical protein VFJ43_17525 [Bacteroidia bacterium]|nr:hypothetical protein [Bacteroidia bacterium]